MQDAGIAVLVLMACVVVWLCVYNDGIIVGHELCAQDLLVFTLLVNSFCVDDWRTIHPLHKVCHTQ